MKRTLRMRRWLAAVPVVAVLALAVWGASRAWSLANTVDQPSTVPVTRVKRGDVSFTVTARGDLQGGKTQMITAPMIGGAELYLTQLRTPGEMVKKDDIVVAFDTTEQVYRQREAEADLAEAEQKVAQARFEAEAKQEEDRLALLRAQADVQLAELEARKNPLVARITARQNELALEAARTHLAQLEKDLADRKASGEASIALNLAARNKAQVQAEMAQRNIDSMTLKAASDGYVSVMQNTQINMAWRGMTLPLFQLGDMVRPGMAVAQIPDLSSWELTAQISELDRGHLKEAQAAEVRMVAFPGVKFDAKVTNLGNTTGPPWERKFECKLGLMDAAPQLRPGLTADIVITTEVMKNALWIPAQALFESDGRTFVYARKGEGFAPQDVTLVRRGESRVVISGLKESQEVALANPVEQEREKKKAPGSATKAMEKGKG
jgi:multidrug efflux pump subunit AcrA (membrane-fusion protein)